MKKRRRRRSKGPIIAIVVFALVVGVLVAVFSGSSGGSFSAYTITGAEYPKKAAVVTEESDAYFMNAFVNRSVPSLIWGVDNKNRLCSPAAAYTELAMIAEATGGETREQALSLLGSSDIEQSRARAEHLFSSVYRDDADGKRIPAASIWLDEDVNFNKDTMKTFASVYHASSFIGDRDKGAYQKAVRAWIEKQTGGILRDGGEYAPFAQGADALMISTLTFDGEWLLKFDAGETAPSVFHTPEGDVMCDFMRNDKYTNVYYEFPQFRAVAQSYKDGCTMWYILPNEGITPESLLADDQLKTFLTPAKQEYDLKKGTFVLRVPKFDVTYTSDLGRSLPELGVTLALDPASADYSPLCEDKSIYIYDIKSDIRVATDENGTKASAAVKGSLEEQSESGAAEFTLDRPFMFMICSPDDLPLFVGIINDPTK